ncbi:MAG: LolA family protein [Paludibacteraceae bacterium]
MKPKKFIGSLLIAMLFVPALFAQSNQNAVKVLNNVVTLIQKNAIQTNFGLTVKEAKSSKVQEMNGTFLMQGNKFVLNTNDMKVYFDGKTQWSYVPDVNEVSISNPTEKELAETNPLALLQAYKNKATIRFAKTTSKTTQTLELFPKSNVTDFKKIVVVVNKSNNYPYSLQLTDKKGMVSTLVLNQFKTGIKTNNNTFVFITKNYKDIEINDLR